MREGAILTGEHGKQYLLVRSFGQPNVWLAVDAATSSQIFVVKQPAADDLPGWPHFQHEMVMHELFKENTAIRKHVDRIRPTSSGEPPRLVLEILQTTLWDARRKREFSDVEIKEIMRAALCGLVDVHAKDMVYADLKMQNILIDGFEQSSPNASDTMQNNNITAKLGDLGIVMSPMKGLVQPIAYRAPEVYFRREISSAIDIWAWGLIYCQLLEAQASFHKYGLYDDILIQGPFWMKENHVQKSINNDFDLGTYAYYSGTNLPHRDREQREGQHWDMLLAKGVPAQEIEFLKWVLNPVPTERPTAQQILDCGWLTPPTRDGSAPAMFQIPNSSKSNRMSGNAGGGGRKHSEPILQHRKRSEPNLFSKFYDSAASQLAKTVVQGVTPSITSLANTSTSTSTTSTSAATPAATPAAISTTSTTTGPPPKKLKQDPIETTGATGYVSPHQSSVNESILATTPGGAVQGKPVGGGGMLREERATRPATPRSSTQRPSTFLNYGAFMR